MAKQWKSSLFFFLLLGLVLSCSKRSLNPIPFAAGYASCSQSNLGQFQVTLSQSQTATGTYLVTVSAGLVPTPGQIVRVALVTSAGQARDLTQGVTLNQNSTVYQGTLTADDLSVFQFLGIAVASGTQTNFMNETDPNAEFCQLPQPSAQTPVY